MWGVVRVGWEYVFQFQDTWNGKKASMGSQLDRMIKVHISNIGIHRKHEPMLVYTKTPVSIFLTMMHHLNLIMRSHEKDSNWGTFYKIASSLQKYQGHENQGKTRTIWDWTSLETKRLNATYSVDLNPFL